MGDVKVVGLRAGYRSDVPFVATGTPSLGWRVETDEPNWLQAGFEVRVERAGEIGLFAANSDAQHQVPWPFAPLTPREQAVIAVRVLDAAGAPASDWSAPLTVRASFLDVSDWQASMVAPPWAAEVDLANGMPLLYNDFSLDCEIHCAYVNVTAQGLVELELNGARVGDEVLAPGWTKYDDRILYSTYEVTDLVRSGTNRIGAWLAEGWYRGRFGFEGGARDRYGDRVGVLAQLEVHCTEGHLHVIGTDGDWKVVTGPIVSAGLYEGETFDASRYDAAWSKPGTELGGVAAEVLPFEHTLLRPMSMPPVRRQEELSATLVREQDSNWLIDFGQNASGRLRISIDAPAGHALEMGHAEVLEHGELGTRPLRQAKATDVYISAGRGRETWEPRFTIHGFRYVELRNVPAGFTLDDVRFIVCHSDMERRGSFSSSHALVNRLHENVVWSTKSNFVSIPTDCPQRDERLGWTGDIAAFVETASFLYDVDGFLACWLDDLAAEQRKWGTVPVFIPYFPTLFPVVPMALWGDATVLVPYALYQRFGDVEILRAQYASMVAWVDNVAASMDDDGVWRKGMQLGDWLDPAAPPDRPAAARTQNKLVATAYAYLVAMQMADISRLLGEDADAARFSAHAAHIRKGFRAEYVTPNGRMSSDAQTAFAIAIMFDLLEPEQMAAATKRIGELVIAEQFHIGTGFAGTPLMCPALTKVGRDDLAYAMLLEDTCPSWLYPVTMGATTIWERWDSMLPNGDINPGDMTSFNHYALGAVADWLHRTVAGLAPDAPGYKRIRFAPIPGGGLTHAKASLATTYGTASISWDRTIDSLTVHVVVPPNTTAVLALPGVDEVHLGSGTHRATVPYRDPAGEKVEFDPYHWVNN